MSAPKEKRKLLTEEELNFVQAYRGNTRDVARVLKISAPMAQKIYSRKQVQEALAKRQDLIIAMSARREQTNAKKLGITRDSLMAKLWEIANTPMELTNNTFGAQKGACEVLGRWIGCDLKVVGDPAELFRERSLEDNLFFAQHGYFPEDAAKRRGVTGGNSQVN